MLQDRLVEVEDIFIDDENFRAELAGTGCNPDKIKLITPQLMRQISAMSTPPGVLALCKMPERQTLPDNLTGLKVFYLDGIRDPGNLGTILRIADWFGLDWVLMSPDSVDLYNPKVLHASMGSVFRVKSAIVEPMELRQLSGVSLFVCDTNGKNIYTITKPIDGILILGNEASGVSHELKLSASDVLSIPGERSLGAESLNVATAAAILAAWWQN